MAQLWYGIASGPLLWAAMHSILYAVSSLACQLGFLIDMAVLGINALSLVMLLITLVVVAGIAVGGYLSLKNWRLLRDTDDGVGTPSATRNRFMAFSGLVLAIMFGAASLTTAIPPFFFGPCR
jgi:hypothetical protein